MSILSKLPDGFGFYYGFAQGDYRQINLRYEPEPFPHGPRKWCIYIGLNDPIGFADTFDEAEAKAIQWLRDNPL